MAAVRCGVRAVQLLLLLAAASSRFAPVDAAGQPASLVEAEKPYDSDLVFEDESSQLAASAAAAAFADTKPLLLDDIDRSPAGRSVEDMLLAVRGSTDDTVEPWDGADLSDDGDDEEEDESELDDENDPELEEDESENEIGAPSSQDNEDGAGQGWLMRSVKRIKRSLDSLWTSTDGSGSSSATQQPNDTKRAQGMRKVKKGKKSNQEKKNKLKKKQKLKKSEQDASAGVSEPTMATSKGRKAHHTGPAKSRLPAAQSLTPPATKFAGKSGRFVGVRPKRQFDYGPIDNEGSGEGFDGSGEPPLWVNYKLQLTIPEPYQDSFRKVDQSDERILRYQADLSRLVNDVALLDHVDATIVRLEPYTLNRQLTLVTATFDAPQNIDLDELEENIIKQLQGPGYSLRSDGVALTLSSDDGDATTTSFPDEDEEDNTPETTVAPPLQDVTGQKNKECRGDDVYFCSRTGQCIGDVQRCDGEIDCDDGEDEANCPTDCRPSQISCDGKCLEPEKRCDRTRDCSDGIDEQNCPDEPEEPEGK